MLEFDEKTHTYTLDGVVLPSVTEVIRFLNYDTAVGAKSWLRDAAADRGTRIHQYCEDIDYGAEPDEIDFDCLGYIQAYKQFLRDYRPQWEQIEWRLGNIALGCAGTVDRYGMINGRVCALDIKTGTTVNKVSVSAQLTGYSGLIINNGFAPTETAYCLQLCKDGKYRLSELSPYFSLFKSCLDIHLALKKGKGNERY